MAASVANRVTQFEEILVDEYSPDVISLMFAEEHPFGDLLFNNKEQKNVKTWKAFKKVRGSANPKMSPVGQNITPGAYSSPDHIEVTRTMRAVSSRAQYLKDQFMLDNDPLGQKAYDLINEDIEDHYKAHVRLIIKELIGGSGTPLLFTIPRIGAGSYAVDIEVPVDAEYYEWIWNGMVVSIHEVGNSTPVTGLETVMVKNKRDNSTTYPGYPCTVTFDVALTGGAVVPAAGAEVVPQNSYSYGMEGLPALLNEDGAVNFMGFKADTHPDWRPLVFDAQTKDISLIDNIGPVVHKLKRRGAKNLFLLMSERQQYKLEEWIRNHQVTQAKPKEMKGGWEVMELTVRSTKLKYMIDPFWTDEDAVAIIDLDDLLFHFWSESGKDVVTFRDFGNGSKKVGKAIFHPVIEGSTNSYITDIESYTSGLICGTRQKHAKIKNLAV